MDFIKINSGIKKYEVRNEHDEVVATLLIDSNDVSIIDRLSDLFEESKRICEENDAEMHGVDISGGISIETARKINDINRRHTNQIIREIENLVGDGVISEIFADNYALNPDFVPDVTILADFISQIIPIVESIFKDKMKSSNKYGSDNRGKKTSADRIARLKAKEGESVE